MDASLLKKVSRAYGEDRLPDIKKRVEELDYYRIRYQSGKYEVEGFVIEPKMGENLPCLIVNRGGSGDFGKWEMERLFGFLSRFASWGYIVIASQYRGCGGSEGKDEFGGSDIEDVVNLYKILKDYPRADTEKIGMYGASRGGMMTYLMLAKVRWLRAAVSVAGLANKFRQQELRPDMKEHQALFFNPTKAELTRRSAVFWADQFAKKTPLLMIHGTADWRVSVLDSIELAQELYENKIPFRLNVLEGGDHGLTEHDAEKMRQIHDWFDRFVKKGEKLPNLKYHGK